MALFKDIYKEYGKSVYRFLLSLTGDESLSEELISETFYQAFLHMDKFEGRCSVFTWLCQIGKNAWLKECRRRKRFEEKEIESLDIKDVKPNPEEKAVQNDTCERIRKAVYHLEEPYQNVFILRVFGERKFSEIGRMYDKTENWARVTYFRAKSKILQEAEYESEL